MGEGSTERKRRQSQYQYTGMWIRPDKRLAIYLRDRFRCVACGADLHRAPASWITLDHITPQEQGGSNEPDNVYTACKGCNCSRGAKTVEEAYSRAAAGRIRRQVKLPIASYRDLAKALIAGEITADRS